MVNKYPRMSQFARTLPLFAPGGSKEGAAGVEPFDPLRLHEQAATWSHGERMAVQFLLAIFNYTEYQFDVMEAFSVWDDEHRAAFLRWATGPWWM